MTDLDPWIDAAVLSARRSRERLAEASRRLRENPTADPAVYAMTEDLSRIIAPLYAVELREPESVRHHLHSAMTQLVQLRDRLLVADPVQALTEVNDALLRLHPNERAIARATLAPSPPSPPLPPPPRRASTPPPPPSRASTPPPSPGRASTPTPPPPPRDLAVGWTTLPPSADRRVSGRARVETDLGYQSASSFHTGLIADLGDGGLFIATRAPLPVGTALTVSFVLPGGHHVVTEGVVRWIREGTSVAASVPPGMGVEFVRLSREDLGAILAFAAEHEPLPSP